MSKVVQGVYEILDELARYKRLVRKLKDPANWAGNTWRPVKVSDATGILRFIDQELNEDQPKLPV